MKKLNRKTIILIGLLVLMFLVFSYGCLIYPYRPDEISGSSLEPPSMTHWVGTDNLGIDIFAQLSRGYFNSMLVGIVSCVITLFLGSTLGIASGYFSGKTDMVISFIINFFLSIPQLPIMVVIGAFLGQSVFNIVLVVSLFSWARIAKIVRAKTIAVKKQRYISIAKSYGAGFLYIFNTHMKNELMPLIMVNSVSVIGKAIIQEASLAFLGLSDPSSKSWGLMINNVINFSGIYYTDYWKWWLIGPLFCLIVTIVIFRSLIREMEQVWSV